MTTIEEIINSVPTKELRNYIQDPAVPKRGLKKRLHTSTTTSGYLCTLKKEWAEQWNIEVDESILVFVDDEGKLCLFPEKVTPVTEKVKESFDDGNVLSRNVFELGNSLAVSIPNDFAIEKFDYEGKTLTMDMDYSTSLVEGYDPHLQRKEHQRILEEGGK